MNSDNGLWMTDFLAALKLAGADGKAVLLNFTGSDWCPWCVKLSNEVFNQEAFVKYAKEKLVLVKVDFPRSGNQSDELKRQNHELAAKFGIQGYPTNVILNSQGVKIGMMGYQPGGAESYVEKLKQIVK